MAFIVHTNGHARPAHRMIDNPPVDPVRVVILILAVAFLAFVVWVL